MNEEEMDVLIKEHKRLDRRDEKRRFILHMIAMGIIFICCVIAATANIIRLMR